MRTLTDTTVKLGSARPGHWNGREDRRLAGTRLAARAAAEANQRAAKEAYADLRPIIEAALEKGRRERQETLGTLEKRNGTQTNG